MPQPDLFIPHKTMPQVVQPGYGDDMRTIEMWVRSLKSGGTSGGVVFNAVANSTGSGAAVPIGGMTATLLGTGQISTLLPLFAGDTGYPSGLYTGTVISAVIGGGGWYNAPGSAVSYNVLGTIEVIAPNFTGPTPTITVAVELHVGQVVTTAGTVNGFRAASKQITIASSAQHNFVTGDFSVATIQGTDLTFTNTPFATLKSTGGLPYIGGWSLIATWDTANTLTQA